MNLNFSEAKRACANLYEGSTVGGRYWCGRNRGRQREGGLLTRRISRALGRCGVVGFLVFNARVTTENNLRSRLAAGEELLMLRGDINWSKEQLAAAWATDKHDFIWLDAQHSPYSDHHLVSFTGAAEQLGIPVQLRIPHTREAHKVGRFFDLGVSGALVPEVMLDQTVQDAVDFAYYGPIGRRSWGGANRLGFRNKTAPTSRREYADWWNSTVLLSIQIESIETVKNIAKLVRPGITHVTWGPNDLEFSLEKHRDKALNSVEACMQYVAEQLDGSGIRISMGTASVADERHKYRPFGVTIFQAAS